MTPKKTLMKALNMLEADYAVHVHSWLAAVMTCGNTHILSPLACCMGGADHTIVSVSLMDFSSEACLTAIDACAQECSHSLYVADREGAAVHRFSLDTRQHEGALSHPCMQPICPFYGHPAHAVPPAHCACISAQQSLLCQWHVKNPCFATCLSCLPVMAQSACICKLIATHDVVDWQAC